jgi:hypothetical protein
MDSTSEESDKIIIRSNWEIPAVRESVYAIASDFEGMPKNFPKIAHSMKILARDGNRLTIEAEAASFGKIFPHAKVSINAELIPGWGYRCKTFNHTFKTRGEEQLILSDTDNGTRIEYAYIVTVERKWLRPLYAWLVRTLGLPFWKRCYLKPLTILAQEHRKTVPANESLGM